uniref:HTH CENPB-type domain-containing protein n=1 Tax=Eptatretus burgeri TaxID=7764 RepID=A0A8C4QLX5_EPTBU
MFTSALSADLSTTVMGKRKAIDLPTKVEIIEKVEAGQKQAKVCLDYALSKQTVSNIISNKDKVKEAFEKNATNKKKKIRTAAHGELDEALLKWYTQIRAKGIPLNGPLLVKKAKAFAELLNLEDFKASDGWLDKFKKRHGLKFKVRAGEAESVPEETTRRWIREVLPKHLEGWSPENVFNCDESGLFWKMLPNRTLARKGEECHGAKKSKERVTLMFATNADGSEKYRLTMIGKFQKPRCFKNVSQLPVDYYAQKNAWMDRYVFKQWLEKFDHKMTRQGRKVLLFWDSVSSHITDNVELKSTTVVSLPPNTTSKLQPLDQGIMETCKKRYRGKLNRQVVLDIESGVETKISLLDAISMVSKAWDEVSPTSIANCFRRAGFKFAHLPDEVEEEEIDEQAELEDRNIWNFIATHLDLPAEQTFEDYVHCDMNLGVDESALTDQEIVAEVTGSTEPNDAEVDGIEEIDSVDDTGCKSASEALRCWWPGLGPLQCSLSNLQCFHE